MKETFEVTYTWVGTLEVEAKDEDDALKEVNEQIGDCAGDPRMLFDLDDETMEVTG